jgi:anthranilate 1,2-dioxygenase small subunit
METTITEMMLWYDLHRLQERYVSVIDADSLEEWPDLFTEDCVYEIVPKENADLGLPIGIMHCFGRPMLRDRIVSLRNANVFEQHTYRHLTSGLEFKQVGPDTVDMQSSYVVIQTLTDGESRVYQASVLRSGRANRKGLALPKQEGHLRHLPRADSTSHSGLISLGPRVRSLLTRMGPFMSS